MALTDIQVKNAKADSKPRKLSDEKGLTFTYRLQAASLGASIMTFSGSEKR